MSIPELFIRRPVMTCLVMFAILLFGVVSYRNLAVSDLPSVDRPTITVSASFPGANPETMASAIATPLERQFSQMAGVQTLSSSSGKGSTNITIEFALDRDIDAAAQDVQAAIAAASRNLPSGMPAPPSFRKTNFNDTPVILLSLRSPVLPLSQVFEYADDMLSPRISAIDGVAQVQVYGAVKYAVRVQVDPRKLQANNVSLDDVNRAIQAGNVNLPTGTLSGPNQSVTIEANGQLLEASAYRSLVVAWRDGAPIRLADLGNVIDDVEDNKSAAWRRDERAIVLAIMRQPGTNTVAVVDSIKALMPTFQAQLPASVNLEILSDRSQTIRQSVGEVKFTLLLTMGLVILVIFLFLRNIPATIIPGLALPMSVIGTFAVMYVMHFTIDNLSLIALTLAVGFVVDDAIVMLENIVRHVERGEKPMLAALIGSREIGFTIISMTISLVAVFIPVLFMGGIVGKLFNEFAITIAAAILVSGVVSLTLTPMLCSRFLRSHKAEHHNPLFNASERVFDAMLATYRFSLRQTLRVRPLMLIVFIASLVLTGWLFTVVPRGFISNEDLGQINIGVEYPQGTSFDRTVLHQKALASILADDPNIDTYMSRAGTGSGMMMVRLKTRDQGRRQTIDEIVNYLRVKVAAIPGVRPTVTALPSLSFGGRGYQITLQCPDTDTLYHYGPIFEAAMRDLPSIVDVSSDLKIANPQVTVEIDRDKAASLGVSVQQIEDAFYTAFGSRQVSTMNTPNNLYEVILELAPQFQSEAASLDLLTVRSAQGQLVPVSTFTHLTSSLGPASINHLAQLPAVTLSFNLATGTALGDATATLQDLARNTLPATIQASFQGTAQAFNDSMKGLGILLVLAILVIYIILGILYESFIHPFTILSGLPSAGVGALLALKIFNMELGLYAFVGIILLVGIVKKNAIMMIDFALEAQRKEGLSAVDAIYQGALTRFRPIMMTTMAALMGTLPIAIGVGTGAASRRPLGVAVVGGLVLSQALTLYITPVFFVYMEGVRRFFARLFGTKSAQAELDAAAGNVGETTEAEALVSPYEDPV
jgi:HAE1 family hydrophobic/amphiphilic exporter-1